MFKFIAFLVLSLYATYMDSVLTFSKVKNKNIIPISNQLPA